MRFLSTRASGRRESGGSGVGFATALLQGLAPDGGLYMPERIQRWSAAELGALPSQTLVETAVVALKPYLSDELPAATIAAVVDNALPFPIPLVEIEPGTFALELFHGPTLAFKDVGARLMARTIAAVRKQAGATDLLTVLVATSGDTGSAVGHAYHGVEGTRVVILYPDGRVSPTQEAQLAAFNSVEGANVRAYAVAGTFDDCQRLVKGAFADERLRAISLTSANSINIGRLLPQMVYYLHAAGLLCARGVGDAIFSTPSGNFGNLTAGVMAKRSGAPIAGFVAATNINDVVPAYLATGRFAPRASIATIANAMDCGNPSNFDRLFWLYGGSVDAMRADIAGSAHADDEVRGVIKSVFEERGYLLDPHSAIAYLGIAGRRDHQARVFLATAHPAKFGEIVEPIIGRAVEKPAPLAAALLSPREILRIEATAHAVRGVLQTL
jgi:threonine synthase